MENTENTFAGAAKEAARIMEQSPYRTYRISYKDGTFLTYWSGISEEHARDLAADYYHISHQRLVAQLEQ